MTETPEIPEARQCGRSVRSGYHPRHKFMLGRQVYQCCGTLREAPEYPPAAIEAAAKAACEAAYPPSPTGRAKAHDSWDEIEEWERDAWRATAAAAVAAALPHLNPEVYVVHHNDIEKHAEHFNEGSGHIADALLSEADLEPAEPTFTASEVKERLETATEVALALGRKEAAEEIAEAIKKRRDEADRGWPLLTEAYVIARDVAREPRQAASEPRTVPSGHSDLPPTPEAAEESL